MNILTVGAAGVAAVLLAVWMKGVRGEYALYVVIAAQLFFLFYGIGRLSISRCTRYSSEVGAVESVE